MNTYAKVVFSSFREAALFNVIGGVIALGALILIQIPVRDSFGFAILLESTGLMLIGGAMGVAGQATTRKITEILTKRKLDDSEIVRGDFAAALYALTGVLLFAEAFFLSLLLS